MTAKIAGEAVRLDRIEFSWGHYWAKGPNHRPKLRRLSQFLVILPSSSPRARPLACLNRVLVTRVATANGEQRAAPRRGDERMNQAQGWKRPVPRRGTFPGKNESTIYKEHELSGCT